MIYCKSIFIIQYGKKLNGFSASESSDKFDKYSSTLISIF